jgi:7-cyano-7-deazaguanine synthase
MSGDAWTRIDCSSFSLTLNDEGTDDHLLRGAAGEHMKKPTSLPEFVDLLESYFGPTDDPQTYIETARYIEGVEFNQSKCFGCPQNCCTMTGPEAKSAWITFAEEDLQAIYARYPDAPRIPKRKMRRGKDGRRYYYEDKTRCAFLGADNLCTVYEARPRWCRDWPKTDYFLRGFEDLEYTLAACPGASYSSPVVVLNSGGIDSLVTIAWLKSQGHKPHSIFVDYGQPAAANEEAAALAISNHYDGELSKETVRLDLWKRFPFFFGDTSGSKYALNQWVPMRNFIFFGIAASYCDGLGIPRLALPWNGRQDRKGKPADNSFGDHPRFIELLAKAFDQSSDLRWTDLRKLDVLTPLRNHNRRQTVQLGKRLGVPFAISWSCEAAGEKPCWRCSKCVAREKTLSLGAPAKKRPRGKASKG